MLSKSFFFKLGIVSLAFLVLAIYSVIDPETSDYFPSCPFKNITSLDCPGCGSQRAIHDILHFDIKQAFMHNALLVLSIPYLIVGYLFEVKSKASANTLRIRKALYGPKAIYIVIFVIILFGIGRNLI